jgi:hypothetical protein
MILFTATVIGKRPVAILEDISVSVTTYGNISLTNDRAINSHFSHELSYSLTIMVAVVLRGIVIR